MEIYWKGWKLEAKGLVRRVSGGSSGKQETVPNLGSLNPFKNKRNKNYPFGKIYMDIHLVLDTITRVFQSSSSPTIDPRINYHLFRALVFRLSCASKSPGGHIKTDCWLHPQIFWFSRSGGGAWEFQFLTSSQVMVLLVIQELHF